jgi:hypothetical protein
MRRLFALVLALALAPHFAQAGDAAIDYRLRCSGCHGLDGMGARIGRIPPFPGILGHIAAEPEGRRYLVLVPGVANAALSDAATAGVLNFAIDAWGGEAAVKARPYTADEVAEIRRSRIDDIVGFRKSIAEKLSRRGVSIAY